MTGSWCKDQVAYVIKQRGVITDIVQFCWNWL